MRATHPTSPQIGAEGHGKAEERVKGPRRVSRRGGEPRLTAFVGSGAQIQVLLLESLVALLKEADVVDGLAQDSRFIQLQAVGRRHSTGGRSGQTNGQLSTRGGTALLHSCLRAFAPAVPSTWNVPP